MSRADMAKLPGRDNPLVKKYLDKAGKRRHVGIAHRLKESQFLVCKQSINASQVKFNEIK